MSFAVSLRPRSRFIAESIKSPNWPTMLTIIPRPTRQIGLSNAVLVQMKCAITATSDVVKMIAPSAPPTVLFGLVFGKKSVTEQMTADVGKDVIQFHGKNDQQ